MWQVTEGILSPAKITVAKINENHYFDMSSLIIFQAFFSVKCSAASSLFSFLELKLRVSPVSGKRSMRQTSMDDTLKTQFFTLKFDFYNFNSIHEVEQQLIRESIAEVFVTEIKGHEVSNHSAIAMLLINHLIHVWLPNVG